MSDSLGNISRLDELLAAQAIGDLSIEERAELDRLLAALSEAEASRSVAEAGAAVGAVAAALHGRNAPAVSPALRSTLLAQGLAVAGRQPAPRAPSVLPEPASSSILRSPWSGWIAAAAAIAIAAFGWLRPVGHPATPHSEPVWAQRERLIQDNDDTVMIAFNKTEDPVSKGLQEGDVVWNQRLQRGFLRFRGLPKNDPAATQYQIWIADKTRPSEYAISGGVFNTEADFIRRDTGDIVIPIDAQLIVRDPAAFAVTIENAGGVVVTGHERVIALAKPTKPIGKP